MLTLLLLLSSILGGAHAQDDAPDRPDPPSASGAGKGGGAAGKGSAEPPPNGGEPPPAEDVLLVVAIDDREVKELTSPVLTVDGADEPQVMLDDGMLVGDVPGDNIWLVSKPVDAESSVKFSIIQGETVVYTETFTTPAAGETAFLPYKLTEDGTLVPDPGAREVAGVGTLGQGDDAPLVTQAAPLDDVGDRTIGDDEVLVRLFVDDRALELLGEPTVVIGQDTEPIALTDDGSIPEDEVDDGIWAAEIITGRTQFLTLTLRDKGVDVATLTVFLPSSGQAMVRLRTTENTPPLELAAEPTSMGGSESPTDAGGGTAAVTGTSVDRLSHVIWAGMALFAMAFAYVRNVVWRTWRDEVQPVVRRMDRFLEDQGAAGATEEDA